MTDTAQQHKSKLRDYFDGVGFDRWSAIYGHGEVSRIRRTIREGHTAMLTAAQEWLAETTDDRRPTTDTRPQMLDAGCGTGLLTVALAQQGFDVTAVDIAPQMVAATQERARQAGVAEHVTCSSGDLDTVAGSYDAVACLDAPIHYPRPSFEQMLTRLAGLTHDKFVFTYAPHETLLAALHWVGGRFPKGQRRTDIQMIPDAVVRETLAAAGMQLRRTERISHGFYHVTLVEATRLGPSTGMTA